MADGFETVGKEELRLIKAAREQRARLDALVRPNDSAFTGLAFSGGGIRSATFNLGVLQALAKLKLVTRFDYLSTVSGGGYIGSWLTAWIHHACRSWEEKLPRLKKDAEEARSKKQAAEDAAQEAVKKRDESKTQVERESAEKVLAQAEEAAATARTDAERAEFAASPAAVLDEVIERLQPNQHQATATGSEKVEASPIRWLRQYSNYLTPKLGLFSGDTWAMIGIYLRNTSLNITILILALSALLLLPYVWALSAPWLWQSPPHFGDGVFLAASVLLVFSLAITISNLSDLTRKGQAMQERAFGARPWIIHVFVIGLCFLAATLLAAWIWASRSQPAAFLQWGSWRVAYASGLTALAWWVMGWVVAAVFKKVFAKGDRRRIDPDVALGLSAQVDRKRIDPDAPGIRAGRMLWITTLALPSGAVGGLFVHWLFSKLSGWAQYSNSPEWHIGMWGVPCVVVGFLVVETIHIGLVGRGFTEDVREWWGRLGGLTILWALALSALFAISLDMPLLLQRLNQQGYLANWGKALAAALAALVWGGVTGAGIWVGRSQETRNDTSFVKKLVVRTAPVAFVIGLLLLLSLGLQYALPRTIDAIHRWECVTGLEDGKAVSAAEAPLLSQQDSDAPGDLLKKLVACMGTTESHSPSDLSAAYWKLVERSRDPRIIWILLTSLILAGTLSWRVGINEFSMHAFYRNRLVRCYLGASRGEAGPNDRHPQPFTGFDPDDDFLFSDLLRGNLRSSVSGPEPKNADAGSDRSLWYKVKQGWNAGKHYCRQYFGAEEPHPAERVFPGPLHIANATLNLVAGKNLAWQTRKAASFILSAHSSGFQIEREGSEEPLYAYQLTKTCAQGPPHNPLTLGMAMATSGAAASPNMGYHTSAPLAFLMTVFNVRLGWWLPNPAKRNFWMGRGPHWGLLYLLTELTGQASADRKYVYLSDGGHFENLGIYELVRRGCRYIVACDVGADPELTFADLGNAIEKCRTDLGVNIKIDVDQIRRNERGKSTWHCAVGRIFYDDGEAGTLLYIKSSLTGDEPADVLRYANLHPAFPHQTTADQFFDEAQFESYRMLGYHTTMEVFEAAGEAPSKRPLEEIFLGLRQHWLSPPDTLPGAFTKHTATYRALIKELQGDANLRFLDIQVWPEWADLVREGRESGYWRLPEREQLWLPTKEAEIRAGFYFCNRVIQLMEDAYMDLNFEGEWEHPDHRGWVNLFQHWAFSGMFCATYAVSANLYGARFQRFCERRLDLHPGQIQVPVPATVQLDSTEKRHFYSLKPMVLNGRSSKEVLRRACQHRLLNFWEVELVETFVKYCEPDFPLHILPFRVCVRSPGPERESTRAFSFGCGFALAKIPDQDILEISYFRIQNHLRVSGYAHQVLQLLLQRYKEVLFAGKPLGPEQIRKLQRDIPEGSALWEAILTEESVRRLQSILFSCKAQAPTDGKFKP